MYDGASHAREIVTSVTTHSMIETINTALDQNHRDAA